METRFTRRSMGSIEDLLTRIRGEFLEMPGLCLTRQQASTIVDCYLILELRALNETKSFSTAVSRYATCIFRTVVCFR
jgi:hypothetical protein